MITINTAEVVLVMQVASYRYGFILYSPSSIESG